MRSALLVLLAFTSSAMAQQQQGPACVKRTDLVRHLADKFQEAPVASGVADNGSLLEIFATFDGATWTAALTMPSGVSCLVATGNTWTLEPHRLPGHAL